MDLVYPIVYMDISNKLLEALTLYQRTSNGWLKNIGTEVISEANIGN